jgi:hypothetical protein
MARRTWHDRLQRPAGFSMLARKQKVESAIAMLNSLHGAASKRVREILRLTLAALKTARVTTDEDFRQSSAQFEKLRKIELQVNELLKRYVGVMRVLCDESLGLVSWEPRPYRSDAEFRTVVVFMNLLAAGYFPSIGECACGTYFYARSTSWRFCSTKCRERFWENSEERKERKRQNARRYYWLHKTTNVK